MRIKSYLVTAFVFLFTCWYGQDYKKLNLLRQDIYSSPKDTQVVKDLFNFFTAPANNIAKDTVIEYLKFAYSVSSKIPFDKITGNVCSTLGNHYNSLGDYKEALKYLFEAEKIYIRNKSYRRLSSTYSTIGNTYLGLNKLPEQKIYYSKSYEIAVEHHLLQEQPFGAGGLASYYGGIKDYAQAIKWNEICIDLFKQQKKYIGYCISLSNGAGYYIKMDNMKKAEEYLDLSEKNLSLAKLNYASFVCYEGKAELLTLQKKYSQAIEYLKKALALMIEDKAIHNISETYKRLSLTAYDAKMYKESTDYLILHIQYKDSVFNETNSKQLLDVQEKYESEKKNVQIQLLNTENDFNKSELNRKMVLIYAGIAVTCLLLLIFVFVIKSNVQKNKTNRLLENQKVIIEAKQKEILDSIYYARRIQKTLLPSEKYIEKNINKLKEK
ncbi:MAG: tetratricopeptide repeat protein [Bacteroidetes bacterium]|nr:tetratricopeptide repeat protein [Bacteroidota bacterium]